MPPSQMRTLFLAVILFTWLICIVSFASAESYVYDDLNRLTEAHFPDGSWIKYDYDEVGNLTTRTNYGYFSINAVAGAEGSISPATAQVLLGESQAFAITPTTGYHVADVVVDGVSRGPFTSYTFNNVSANHTIAATFAINTYTITTAIDSADYGGTFSPSSASVIHGNSQSFTITPDTNFSITDVKVDGVSQGSINSHTFSNVTAPHSLTASFAMSCPDDPVKNSRSNLSYSTLQAAYNAALDGDTILSNGTQRVENFTADRSIFVTLDGGYKCDFSSNPYKTIIKGAPRLSVGTVKLKNIRISP